MSSYCYPKAKLFNFYNIVKTKFSKYSRLNTYYENNKQYAFDIQMKIKNGLEIYQVR